MERLVAHLQMIQAVIARLAQNSSSMKGWSVTLVAAVLALSATTAEKLGLRMIALLPLAMFWMLDGFYLGEERRLRRLYDTVRIKAEDQVDFSMAQAASRYQWVSAMFSKSVLLFHGTLLAGTVALIIFLGSR